MNCDDVFDQLTEPGRGMTRDLKWHLDRCPRCRQLHEVLKPALSLFGGDDPPREPGGNALGVSGEGLPAYDAVRLAERTAASLSKKRGASLSESRSGRWLLGAACACGLLAGSLVTAGAMTWFGDEGTLTREAPVAAVRDECIWQSSELAKGSEPRPVILSCVACHVE